MASPHSRNPGSLWAPCSPGPGRCFGGSSPAHDLATAFVVSLLAARPPSQVPWRTWIAGSFHILARAVSSGKAKPGACHDGQRGVCCPVQDFQDSFSAASAAIVVASPCPGSTAVSPGNTRSLVAMEERMTSRQE